MKAKQALSRYDAYRSSPKSQSSNQGIDNSHRLSQSQHGRNGDLRHFHWTERSHEVPASNRSAKRPNRMMAAPRKTTKGEMAIHMVNRVIKYWNLDKKDARVKRLQALA